MADRAGSRAAAEQRREQVLARAHGRAGRSDEIGEENSESEYIAYVSEQNLLPDETGEPVRHPQVKETFERAKDGSYRPREHRLN